MTTIKRIQIQGKTYFYEIKNQESKPLFMIEYGEMATSVEVFDTIPKHYTKQRQTVALMGDYRNWNKWLKVQVKSPRITENQRKFLNSFFRKSNDI